MGTPVSKAADNSDETHKTNEVTGSLNQNDGKICGEKNVSVKFISGTFWEGFGFLY